MKRCKKCNELFPLSLFPLCRGQPRARCKSCHSADAAQWVAKNRERYLAKCKANYQRKRLEQPAQCLFPPLPAHLAAVRRKEDRLRWVANNRDRDLESKRSWAERNPHVSRESVRRRQAKQRNATPPWANKAKMQEIYAEASHLSKETGVRYEVDHIVPLTNPLVCGLHCEFNLRSIPSQANRSKANKFAVDEDSGLVDFRGQVLTV